MLDQNLVPLPGELQQIDNQVANNEVGLAVVGLKNIATSLRKGLSSDYGMKVKRSVNFVVKDDPDIDSGFKVGDFDTALMNKVNVILADLETLKEWLGPAAERTDSEKILSRNIERFEDARIEAVAELKATD